jgi:CheY-like chemotaxis protein
MSAAVKIAREAIVCVDDEPLVLHALSGALSRKLGPRYSIELASNGAEALELIEELGREHTRLRFVVSDAMMPIMDGYALIEWLHEHMPHVPKIIITGYGHEARIDQLRQEAGLLACFRKPWQHEELLSFIERALVEG